MPFTPVKQEKCPKCDKAVYAAEAKVVGDLKFHKECYKCSMCQKFLDSTNVNCHEAVLFCKTCHGRKYGPKGYGFGGGAAGLSMDTGSHLDYGRDDKIKEYKPPKAAPGEGCPRCGGKVFAAEEMLAKGKVYHKTCFNCKTCRKALDSVNHCDGPDKEVYCKPCYGGQFGPKGYGYGHGAGALQSKDTDVSTMVRPHGNPDVIIKPENPEDGCPRCGGKVFSAEEMLAKGRSFHRKCFKCKVCTRPLDSMTHCDGPDGEIYCKLCYAKKYGPKGYGFASGGGGVLTAENIPGGADQVAINPATGARDVSLIKAAEGEGCPRCGGKVFMAEEMLARGRSWHKRCFSCCHCHRPLDSVVGCDAPDGEVYCKLCYAKRYGPKGYGFSAGAGGVLSGENIGGGLEDLQRQQQAAFTSLDVSKIQAAKGEGCPRCGGKVFMAEEIHARKRSWHKRCYNCCHCHRPLDSVVGCDAPDGEVYCKLCYAKKYGPKGYGFSAGGGGVLTAENIPGGVSDPALNPASVAIDTTAILAAPGEGCPRCGGKVFSAEEKLSRGNRWHKRCYNCCDCHRPLDSMVLCDGPDGEIYCKLCYAKKFGPKGYGFASGAGGVLFPESLEGPGEDQARVVGNAPAYITQIDMQNMTPAKEGQAQCPRCGGAVFQAESLPVRGREWHKQCYNCVECKRPLDSMIGCDAPDGEVYCKLCYAKRHGPKGYGYGHTATLVSLGTDDGTPVPPDIRQFGFGLKGAKHFLEGQTGPLVNSADHGNEVDSQVKTTQKTIINQVKNLPAAGRVPRGVGQGESKVVNASPAEVKGAPPPSVKVIAFGPPSDEDEDEYEDDEEVPTSDITTQTSPIPPYDSLPPMNPMPQSSPIHPSDSNAQTDIDPITKGTTPTNGLIDDLAVASEIEGKMSSMQMDLEQQMKQQLQQQQQQQQQQFIAENNASNEFQSATSNQEMHSMELTSENEETMHIERQMESHESQMVMSKKIIASSEQFQEVAQAQFEVSGQMETKVVSEDVQSHADYVFAE